MGIGNKIKTILQDRNITVTELSKNSGVSRGLLYEAIKRDSNYMRIENLEKIAKALSVSITELREQEQDNSNIDEQKEMLLNNYYKLNSDGKSKLLERSAELTELKKYTK